MFLAYRRYLYLSVAAPALACSLTAAVVEAQTIAAGVGRFKTSSSNARAKLQQVLHGKTVILNQDKITYNPGALKPFTLSSNGGLLRQPLRFTLHTKSSANSYKITQKINGIDPSEFKVDKADCTLTAKTSCDFEIVYVHSLDATVSTTSAKLSISITEVTPPAATQTASTVSMTLPDMDLTGTNQTLVNQATSSGSTRPKIFFNPPYFFESVSGDSSLPQTLTITTEDPVGYTISTTTLSGTDANDYSVTNCLGARLDRNRQRCALTIGSSFKTAKRKAAELTVTLVPDNQTPATSTTEATPPIATITIALSGMAYPSCTGTPGYAHYQ